MQQYYRGLKRSRRTVAQRNFRPIFITSYQVQRNVKESEQSEQEAQAAKEIYLFCPYRQLVGAGDPLGELINRSRRSRDQAIFGWLIPRNRCVKAHFLIPTRIAFCCLVSCLCYSLPRQIGITLPLDDAHPCRYQCLHERLSTGNAYEAVLCVFLERIGDQ